VRTNVSEGRAHEALAKRAVKLYYFCVVYDLAVLVNFVWVIKACYIPSSILESVSCKATRGI